MSTSPIVPAIGSHDATRVRRRQISGVTMVRLHGEGYSGLKRITSVSSHPRYESLAAMVRVLRSPEARARARLKGMTAQDADWNAMGSAPPNETARALAFDVLERSYAQEILDPSLVTASAQGGVGIVYKA